MAERQRLFFALWPDPAVRGRLAAIQQGLSLRRGRLTHVEDLHATLVFLGALTPGQQACAEAAAAQVPCEPFDLVVDRTGFWPRPRIAWCGSDDAPAPLLELVRDLQRRLVACGVEPESRPYRLHVTLARDARAPRTGLLDVPVPWRCESFALVASQPAGETPRYRVLREWPLRAAKTSAQDS